MYRFILFVFALLAVVFLSPAKDERSSLRQGFVDLQEFVPTLIIDLRYASGDNFVGKRIDGYEAKRGVASQQTAQAMRNVQANLVDYGLGLKVFDAYRPQSAVDHFVRWASDPTDTSTRADYYPDVAKKDLIPEDYIAPKSGHSRGSAVDVTLIDLESKEELDMGTRFDHFGPRSHAENIDLSKSQRASRLLLRMVMERHGFKHFSKEWWHFSLANEPFPKTYFDFPIQ